MSKVTPALLLALLLSLPLALPATAEGGAAAADDEVPHILMFTGTYGFRHGSIEHSVEVVQGLAESTGEFTVTHTEDPADFTAETFEATDIILFANTTGETPFTDEQRNMFEAWVRAGGGFMGIHAAADTNYEWPFYQEMVGAAFESHPHTGNTLFIVPVDELDEATVQVETPGHPINADTDGDSFPLREEYYRWQENPRGTQDVQVLLSLDEDDTYGFGNPPSLGPVSSSYDDDQPVEWVKTYRGFNRVWYSNLGHYEATYDRPDWQARFVNAVAWVHDGVHIVTPPTPEPASSPTQALWLVPVGGASTGFAPPAQVVQQGGTGLLVNLDNVEHNVQSIRTDAARKPLFRSAFATGPGGTQEVMGVSALAPGDYEYFCTIHGGMTGTLTVVA